MTDDLGTAALAAVLGDREFRSYPALLSTESTAMAWARQGAPPGAVVVADYQASPRGRGGLPWTVRPGSGLGFTLVLRPELTPEREGWPYIAALLGVRDVVGGRLTWPDGVRDEAGVTVARLGTYVELGPARTEWVSATVLIEHASPPRAPLLARVVEAIESRVGAPAEQVLGQYLPHCDTLGQLRRARLIPMGPGGPEVTGVAVDVLADGALVLRTARGTRVAVPPQNLGLLEEPEGPSTAPEYVLGVPTR